MGRVKEHLPVALIAGVMARTPELLAAALQRLEERFGPFRMTGAPFDFSFTGYYDAEMGPGLIKQFVAFDTWVPPDDLPGIKLATNEMEEAFARENGDPERRCVNIDPGYVTRAKLVLVTTKDYAHRIHVARGIYAEVTLRFNGDINGFEPMHWTYRDYRTPAALAFFKRVRTWYKNRIDGVPGA